MKKDAYIKIYVLAEELNSILNKGKKPSVYYLHNADPTLVEISMPSHIVEGWGGRPKSLLFG